MTSGCDITGRLKGCFALVWIEVGKHNAIVWVEMKKMEDGNEKKKSVLLCSCRLIREKNLSACKHKPVCSIIPKRCGWVVLTAYFCVRGETSWVNSVIKAQKERMTDPRTQCHVDSQ